MSFLAHYISKYGNEDTDVVLISCLLFFAFESFQGRVEEAKLHLQSGFNIMFSTSIKKPKGSYLGEDLVGLFARMSFQGPLYGLNLPNKLYYKSLHITQEGSIAERHFSSLKAARDCLYCTMYSGM